MIFKKWVWGQSPELVAMPPLHWRKLTEKERTLWGLSHNAVAIVTCAQGHECALSLNNHSITTEGRMWPSLQCPVQGCSGHEVPGSTLEGWTP